VPDGIEQFNWYSRDWQDIKRTPTCLHPFMDEIEAFCNYLTNSVNRRLLRLFSRVLELPDDYLWNNVQSHGSPTGEGYFRHALFRPVPESTQAASKGLRMHGHTDFGLTTLLFSVPISCLQIWGRDEKWYYVPYKPGALVVNIGDTLEIVSGGHFKATRHRVYKPPVDQLHEERLSLVLFNSSVGDLRMEPAYCKFHPTKTSRYLILIVSSISFDPTRRLRGRTRRVQGVQEAHFVRPNCAFEQGVA
jgi:isopenicillin N synthase-like dioxygenase